jgi:hypothetical protein
MTPKEFGTLPLDEQIFYELAWNERNRRINAATKK